MEYPQYNSDFMKLKRKEVQRVNASVLLRRGTKQSREVKDGRYLRRIEESKGKRREESGMG